MTKVHYEIVEHDGGWAYKMQDVFSETFPSRDAALAAANRAASEQRVPVEAKDIEFQDKSGKWRSEHVNAGDRPDTDVS